METKSILIFSSLEPLRERANKCLRPFITPRPGHPIIMREGADTLFGVIAQIMCAPAAKNQKNDHSDKNCANHIKRAPAKTPNVLLQKRSNKTILTNQHRANLYASKWAHIPTGGVEVRTSLLYLGVKNPPFVLGIRKAAAIHDFGINIILMSFIPGPVEMAR